MAVHKGGRGLKASYQTTHVRVPIPVKEVIERIANQYRDTEEIPNIDLLNSDEIIELAHRILRHKKSARISLEKFLKSIYKQNIKL